jgi:hypothetical protein
LSKKLRLGASGVLLAVLAWRTDWRQVGDAFAHLHLALWLLGVGVYVLTQLVSSLRWQLLARPLGFQHSLGAFIRFYFIGMFFNLALPTSVGGDVVRAWYLDGRSGRRLNAFVSVLADRCSGLLVLLAMAGVAALVCPLELPGWIRGSVGSMAGGVLLGLAALPLLLRWTSRFSRTRRLASAARLYLRHRRTLLVAAFLSVVVQAANVLLVWLIGQALAVPVPASYYWILVPTVTLLTLLPSINGMGVRENATVVLLAPLGVSGGAAVSLALLWFAAYTTASLAGAGFYLFGHFPRFQVQDDDATLRGDSAQGRARQSPAAA